MMNGETRFVAAAVLAVEDVLPMKDGPVEEPIDDDDGRVPTPPVDDDVNVNAGTVAVWVETVWYTHNVALRLDTAVKSPGRR